MLGKKTRSRINWHLNGDKVSTEFFRAVCERVASTIITSLKDTSGGAKSDKASIQHICVEFFSRLYTAAETSVEQGAAMHNFTTLLSDHFS